MANLEDGRNDNVRDIKSKNGDPILLKAYPVYNRLKKLKGVVLIGRESDDVPVKWKRQKGC